MNVKVCNLRSPDFEKQYRESMLSTGFAVITHHGIDLSLIRQVQKEWREFFNNSTYYKLQYLNPKDSNMGYARFGKETAVGSYIPDIKEFYHWQPGQDLPPFTSMTERLYALLEQNLATQLLRPLNGLGSDMDYAEVCANSNNTILRALYYPALRDVHIPKGAVRAAAHEDINMITLLVAATSSGLEVQDRNGNWHAVPFEENSVVVNVGDQLQLASQGMLKSTTHRVVNPDDNETDRISIPLFIHPHSNTLLAPGVTAQEFLNERLNTIYVGK